MTDSAVLLGAGAAVLVGAVSLLGWHAYGAFPARLPREETNLSAGAYRFVRSTLVVGGAVATLGVVVAAVDTAGTIAAMEARERGVLGDAAATIPEWASTLGLQVGAGLLGAAALVGLVGEVRAWFDD